MKQIIRWFAENTVAANLLMFCLIALGLMAVPETRKELIPNVTLDRLSIQTKLPGGNVETIENSVCKAIENRIYDIQGTQNLTSFAYDGLCSMTVDIADGYETDKISDEISRRINEEGLLPDDAETPTLQELSVKNRVAKLIIYGNTSYAALAETSREIRNDLMDMPDISVIELQDMSKSEIRIEVPAHNLEKYDLTFDDISGMIRQQTGFLPGGVLETQDGDILITSDAYKDSAEAYRNIVIYSDSTGAEILLRDLAIITDTRYVSETNASFDGTPSASIDIYRVGDQSIMDIADDLHTYVDSLRLPETIKTHVWQDESKHLRERISMLLENALAGLVLLFITLLLFLNGRLSFWVSMGIPVSFFGALFAMPMYDVSINAVSLFGFILVLGIVVDDAVVVAEAIHNRNEKGIYGTEAALEGAFEVYKPILFAVITTVIAFIPLIGLPGPEGKMMQAIPIVVIATLIFSVIESFLILPAHLSHAQKVNVKKEPSTLEKIQSKFDGALQSFMRTIYLPSLRGALQAKGIIILVFSITFTLMLVMMLTGWIKSSLFTPVEADSVVARLVLPEGSPREKTEMAVERLTNAAELLKHRYEMEGVATIDHIYAVIGPNESKSNMKSSQDRDHLANITLELVSDRTSRISGREIISSWRNIAGDIPGVSQLSFSASLNPARPDIQIELSANDQEDLKEAADQLMVHLKGFAGAYDVRHTQENTKQQADIILRDNASSLGLTQQTVVAQINQAFQGKVVQNVQTRDDEIEVWLGLPDDERDSSWHLENMHVKYAPGQYVPLSAIADIVYQDAPTHIKRNNRKRVVTVTSFIDTGRNSVQNVQRVVENEILPSLVRQYPGMDWARGGQQRDLSKFMTTLFQYYMVAVLAMYLLLAVLFKSYMQPFIIIYAIPFGIMGSVIGHQLFGMVITSWSYIGMVAVSGVVVNDNLVLMDYINNRREKGASTYDAVIEAGIARFRPILLTSLTTFVGLIPLISETSLQAQFLIPMAISLAFGVLFATLVSLLLVPCTYVLLDDIQVAFRRAFSSGGEENVTVEDAYDEGFKQGNSKARKVNPYSSDLLAASWDAGYQDGTEAR
ncbi:Multidrug efflux pump subunit AcrB [Thalassolituus maritimus]|uniref:Multidrug efflux pump subunit AcrB n=1 Tax=Thalassolituus maritimus TaxID=484498 RepID=A0A1N7PLA1_9GAMM|nr:efflux RND transporter permease subunit [Thalassolituus maritimus]SIT11371.1 Multidrug efflux pump subunit AcrB [Thalassolituus maritimus]